jgi:Zn-dependent M32 family carboxypeptidase
MTYEEMERSMEFLQHHLVSLEQLQEESEQRRTKSEANVQRSIESILEQQAKNTSAIDRLVVLGAKLARRQLQTDRQLARTDKQLAEIAVQLSQVVESQKQLTEAQQHTDARFNAFLSALERRFGGNGRGRKSH